MPATIQVVDASGATQTINTNPALGQALAAASLPVVIASDQVMPLATGAATSAQQSTGNISLTNIDTKTPALVTGRVPVDGSSVTQPISAAALTSLDTKTPALVTGRVPVDGSGVVQPVGGQSLVASASYSRPADTADYTALDASSNSTSAPALLTFTNLARVVAGSGYIVKARLVTSQSTNAARFRLHLFHTAITAVNDNAPFPTLFANKDKKIGYIDFDAMGTEGSGSDCAESVNASARLKFTCAAASRTIYGILQTRDGFTPASAQAFFVELTAEVD